VIDTNTNAVIATIKTTLIPAGGASPSGLAFTPDGKTLLVTLLGQGYVPPGSLVFIDVASGHISPPVTLWYDPERIAMTRTASARISTISSMGPCRWSISRPKK
jgi:YVTN family beta-propeller protein